MMGLKEAEEAYAQAIRNMSPIDVVKIEAASQASHYDSPHAAYVRTLFVHIQQLKKRDKSGA